VCTSRIDNGGDEDAAGVDEPLEPRSKSVNEPCEPPLESCRRREDFGVVKPFVLSGISKGRRLPTEPKETGLLGEGGDESIGVAAQYDFGFAGRSGAGVAAGTGVGSDAGVVAGVGGSSGVVFGAAAESGTGAGAGAVLEALSASEAGAVSGERAGV
jgi:hypothetical protein